MESIIQAKHVIAISKALKRYSVSDLRIATYFHASYMAGRAGLVSSAFRSQDISYEKAVFRLLPVVHQLVAQLRFHCLQ